MRNPSSSDTRGSRLASTDGQGRFELRDLPAGTWEVTASKAGFVPLRFGQRRPLEAGPASNAPTQQQAASGPTYAPLPSRYR